MPRYKLTIEYDGGPFVGWQIQDNGPSVQGVLAVAVEAFCGEKVSVQGAGRTDAGVHALGQVAHIDLARDWDIDNVRDAANFHLRPQPIAVVTAERVADDQTGGDEACREDEAPDDPSHGRSSHDPCLNFGASTIIIKPRGAGRQAPRGAVSSRMAPGLLSPGSSMVDGRAIRFRDR